MLKTSHEKAKNFIIMYFNAFEFQCIPEVNCSVIDKGKLAVVPLLLVALAFFHIRHIAIYMKSTENVLELVLNFNMFVGGIQTIITIGTLNMWSKGKLFQVLQYFDDIVDSEDEVMRSAREEHLKKSLTIAYQLVRIFLIGISLGVMTLPMAGLIQTDFAFPMYYTIPGISSNSIFFYPVNIIGQIFLCYVLVEAILSMDCLLLIYLFYFRGEFFAIASVVELLSDRAILETQCEMIIRTVHKAHRKALNKFFTLSNVMWHFYCQKLFALSLYLCGCLFIFSRVGNSLIIGVLLQSFILSQLLLLCLPGQLIDNCSVSLREALYKILWYDMKLEDQRNLLMLMIGAHKSINAVTFGIGKISIFTFVQICKVAISYAAVAYTVLL